MNLQLRREAAFYCYAKVNFVLRVIGKRPDGYHDIDSLMQTVDLADTVTLRWGGRGVEVVCSDPELSGQANLAWIAASRFLHALDIDEGVRISITKRIPIAAGLGGGSSDAACVIGAMAERYAQAKGPDWLKGIALEIGSDVPYLLIGGLARVRGMGEIVEPLASGPPMDLVIAAPPLRIRSSWAYGRLNLGLTGGRERPSISSLDTAAAERHILAAALHNDLERAVSQSHPVIPRLIERFKDMGALGAVMSGSGPSVVAIAENRAKAEGMVERLGTEGFTAFAVRTTDSGRSARE
jgi:4-diphosphocytidyl-2-C-methyl-D-erythritol kinase